MATDAGPATTRSSGPRETSATSRGDTADALVPDPLTERILVRLGGSRWLWMALWSAVPLLSPLVFSTAIRATGGTFGLREFMDFLATQGGLAYACFVLLWGCGVLGRAALETRNELIHSAAGAIPAALFGAMGSVAGPLLLTAAVVAVTTLNGWLTYGPVPPIAALPLLFAYMLPIQTFVWVYIVILVDINRLGHLPIVLDRFPQDRTLGLERIGSLASTGLGLLLISAVPVLLAGSDEPVTLAVSLTVVVGSVVVFGLSMWRLHRQMAAAKARYVETTRRLYAEAYDPVRADPTLATLVEQSDALGVARALDDRAHDLPTWPLNDGTARFIGVLVTGILTSLIVRALFAAIGF